jgi:hypothetical protein
VTEPVALCSLAIVRLVGALHSLLLDRKGLGPPQRLMRSRALSCSIDAPRCAPWRNSRRDARSRRPGARNEDLALSRLEGRLPEVKEPCLSGANDLWTTARNTLISGLARSTEPGGSVRIPVWGESADHGVRSGTMEHHGVRFFRYPQVWTGLWTSTSIRRLRRR